MDEITKLLRPLELTREDNALIISHLTEKGFIDNRDERMFPSQKLMDLAERGKIHSNIPSEKGYIVIDNSSGRELGEVSIWDSNLSSLLLGGKVWKIIRIIDSKIFVARSTGEWQIPSFTRRFSCGSFVNLLPLEIMRRYIQ